MELLEMVRKVQNLILSITLEIVMQLVTRIEQIFYIGEMDKTLLKSQNHLLLVK